MITSELTRNFFTALKAELAPFPFMTEVVFDENLAFNQEAHSYFVANDQAKMVTVDGNNLIQIIWNREPINPEASMQRRGKAFANIVGGTAVRTYERLAQTTLNVQFVCTSLTVMETLEEWAVVKDLYRLGGTITVDLDPGIPMTLNWAVSRMQYGSIIRLDKDKYGTMFALSMAFTVSYPIILNQEIVKLILQVDASKFIQTT